MKPADRLSASERNSRSHPESQAKIKEPLSSKEWEARYRTVKSRYDEIAGHVQAWETVVWHDVQRQVQRERLHAWNARCLLQAVQEDQQFWRGQYQQAIAEQQQFRTLYQQSQQELHRMRDELKFERRSKASIKGWETRRKAENDRLKREIADMARVLQESMVREGEATATLQALAGRIDRIQNLVDGLEAEPTSPKNLLEKFQKIWQAIREILRE